ncbi:MAG: NAD-dependent epimerase/dehydratase family protein [Chloroflexi bacterium]|nr:NAD-dependent epimerase/dehydratase family protein [Chloroflexota bacterium]
MRILLTGATGFVGSQTARQLVADGHELRVSVRETSDLGPLATLEHESVLADLRDRSALDRACSGVEAVVHVAGLTSAVNARTYREVNGQGTRALAEAAVGAGVRRFVYVSSLAAMGPSAEAESPAAKPHPITPYGRSKEAGEQALLARAGELEVQVLRPPAVYGPRDTGLLPFFKMARRGYLLRFGDGRNRVSMIYAPDLAKAISTLLTAEAEQPAVFHVADGGGSYTWRELIDALGVAFGRSIRQIPLPPVVFNAVSHGSVLWARARGGAPALDRSRFSELSQSAWVCDSAALTEQTGWRPPTTLAAGLAETVTWYRQHGWI